MTKITATCLPCVLLLCLSALSCSARFDGRLLRDGSAELSLRSALEPRMAVLIGNLAGLDGRSAEGLPLVDGPAVAASMRTSPGVAAVSLTNLDRRTVSGTIAIADIGKFLSPAAGGAGERFAVYENRGADGGRLTIALDRAAGPRVLALISPDVVDYLSALMAPAATGEVLGKAEYLSLVASVYGPGIAEELGAAKIRAVLEVPGTVVSAAGGTFAGRKATFDIPLTDVLVLEKPLRLEIQWK